MYTYYNIINDLFLGIDFSEILQATEDTLIMLGSSLLFASLIGIPLGIILFLMTHKLAPKGVFYSILTILINILRSIPFIILMIIISPLTTLISGSSLGVRGAIPPLIVGTFPLITRLTENALNETDPGLLQMAKSYGASTWQTVWYILLPEIRSKIVANLTVAAITLIAYTAMAGTIGSGGLGDLAIRYGYQRFDLKIMLITVSLLVVLVQVIQYCGGKLTKHLKK